jgi:transcriptional antiterminator NusG
MSQEIHEHRDEELPDEAAEASVPEQYDDTEPLEQVSVALEARPEAEAADELADEAENAIAEPEPAIEMEAAPVEAAPEAAPLDEEISSKHWYIIHTYSGFEQKVADSLRTRAQAFGFHESIGQVLIPTEEVFETKNGKKVTSKRLLYPGYVLVEMDMSDELWHAVKNTPRVTGFVGGGNTPVPLTPDEVNSVLYRQASSAERPRPKLNFEKGEHVKITDGPFTNFSGKIDEVNQDRSTLRVLVTIFGRQTPVELDFGQVEKV